MVLIGGMGTIEGPVLGALVLFGLQEALSSYGAWYLVIVGGLTVAASLIAPRGLWGIRRRPVRLGPAPGRLPVPLRAAKSRG
jgi:branched-chain amino acid transport system permease protein